MKRWKDEFLACYNEMILKQELDCGKKGLKMEPEGQKMSKTDCEWRNWFVLAGDGFDDGSGWKGAKSEMKDGKGEETSK